MKTKSFAFLLLLVAQSAFAVVSDEQFNELLNRVEANEAQLNKSFQGISARMHTIRAENKNIIPIGSILPFIGAHALPDGYLPCNGEWKKTADYPELERMLPSNLSTDEEKKAKPGEFKLPDYRGRTLIGEKKNTSKESCVLGSCQGSETARLETSNLPEHKHNGTTSESGSHSHNASTGEAGEHTHTASARRAFQEADGGRGFAGWGYDSNHGNAQRGREEIDVIRAGNHTHSVSIAPSGIHTHEFTTTITNPGGKTAEPFFVLNPSATVRFMVKAR